MGLSELYVADCARIQEALISVARTPGSIDAALTRTIGSIYPGAIDHVKAGKSDQIDANLKTVLYNCMREASLRLTQEANQAQQPPMKYAVPGSPDPVLQQLLRMAVKMSMDGFVDATLVMILLEDLMDNSAVVHCPDIFAWLEVHTYLFRPTREQAQQLFHGKNSPFETTINKNNLLRLCNTLLKRLSKSSDVLLAARVLIFMANFFPLLTERSGLNIPGTCNANYPPARPEVLEAGAVDSQGFPVDQTLYTTFWSLQETLQDFRKMLKPDNKEGWPNFRDEVQLVLKALSSIEVTVPAGAASNNNTAAAAGSATAADGPAGGRGSGAGGGAGSAMQVDNAGTSSSSSSGQGEGEDSLQLTVGYLSSHKLFGLQLRDATFRRQFLVQVLVMLQSLTVAGKGQEVVLKGQQATEAEELQKEVYAALEATPAKGDDFAKMVRKVLARDVNWVLWKRGPGKGAAVADTCRDFSLPAAPPLADTIAAAEAEAAEKRRKAEAVLREVKENRRKMAEQQLEYDEDPEPPPKRRRGERGPLYSVPRETDIIASQADTWLTHIPTDNMAGLKVAERKGFPTLEVLGGRVLRELDPDAGIDKEYKKISQDKVYHWKVARMLSMRFGEPSKRKQSEKGGESTLKDSYTEPANVELQLTKVLPHMVPEAYKTAQLESEAAAKAASGAAAAADKGGAGAGSKDEGGLGSGQGVGRKQEGAAAAAAAAQEDGVGEETTAAGGGKTEGGGHEEMDDAAGGQ